MNLTYESEPVVDQKISRFNTVIRKKLLNKENEKEKNRKEIIKNE